MSKSLVWLIMSIGSAIGAYIPVLFGADGLSAWSIIGGIVGGVAAIFLAYKFGDF